MQRTLIIGGYGNFGRYITSSLAREHTIQVLIAGRDFDKGKQLADSLVADQIAVNPPQVFVLDIHDNIIAALAEIKPDVVVHTSGPFQKQHYVVAESCISLGIHYIDLADGRKFVSGFSSMHARALEEGVLAVSGASSVPCLSAAIIDQFKDEFQNLDSIDYGISVAQKTTRGLATTSAILAYTGKKFTTRNNGAWHEVYGWQDLLIRKYRHLGYRMLGNCDIPDLELFPDRYPSLRTIRFRAGLEVATVHLGLWLISWIVRCRVINNLQSLAPHLLRWSLLFDRFGTDQSAFHMQLQGKGRDGHNLDIVTELTAGSGHGPYIPCIPAILLSKKLATNELKVRGALACLGLITLPEYLQALEELDMVWEVTRGYLETESV